jgi:hypothetical protein
MIAEAAAALSSAHAAGIGHMCLSPGSVRWSQTGEVKVVGLGIDAALSGVASDDPVLVDTRGLGRLLYAALTGCWPGAEYASLPPAPLAAGGEPRSPRQVVAGIPLAFSDLACRAMQLDSKEGSPPVTSASELASALMAAMPPAPVPSAPPPPVRRERQTDYRVDSADDPYWPGRERGGWQRHDYEAASTDYSDVVHDVQYDAADMPQPADRSGHRSDPGFAGRPGRPGLIGGGQRGRRGQRAVPFPSGDRRPIRVLAAAGALAAVAVVAAVALWPSANPPRQAGGRHHVGAKSPSTSVTTLVPVQATGFDPLTSVKDDGGNENTQWALYAIDPDPHTAWQSQWYRTANFGGLKAGSGLIIDMSKAVTFRSVVVKFGPTLPGANVKLLVGNSPARSAANLDSMTTVAAANGVSGQATFNISSSVRGRYLVIWFTKLPPRRGSGHLYMAEVFNVVIRGIE